MKPTSRYSIEALSVLVVDDHRINREFLGTGLSRVAGRVELAEDGPGAIELCEREDFDVILMDLHMPRMDGLATANRIRDLDAHSAHAQMVALTADARPEERFRLLEAGFDDYLNKPISIPDLVEAIEALFNPGARRTPQEQPAAPTQLIDRTRALAAANGEAELASRLQDMLSNELDEKLPELDRMMTAREYGEAAELLHQWAGAGGYAGATRMTQACRMLRQRLLSGLDSSPGTAYLNFLRIAHATRQALRHV
ncbi:MULTISPECIES: response regulator [unclassified Wenzhouxiangella]|uniref:response regulator n=1 Tax=unclassified Wenzhouxiangella TaxID=2613841 RepID=UPI0015F2832C|nr:MULTISPECIES: response regulator [unclassified Wenzhouxiangella]